MDVALRTLNNVDRARQRSRHLPFSLSLFLIATAALFVRLYISSRTYVDFDEWQHAFMAGTPRWTDLVYELETNAHPPLFFLLLRGVLRLGHHTLLYRSISILSGVGSVFLVWLISRKVCRYPIVALLCAAAFAFSAAAIAVSSAVRSYQLAIFFVLLAFLCYLEMFPRADAPARTRPYVFFSVAATLAVFSHYFAALFLGACVLVPLFLASVSPDYRRRLWSLANPRVGVRLAVSLGVPLGVFAVFYLSHGHNHLLQGYLDDFYRGMRSHETAAAFLLRNLQNFSNLFSPVVFQSTPAFVFTLALLSAGALYVLVRTRRLEPPSANDSGWPVLFAMAIILELMVLSLSRKYPFGGSLRHQYIAAPFLVIGAFILLDRLAVMLAAKLRLTLLILTGAAIAVNAAVAWPSLIVYPGVVLIKPEFDHYQATFPTARAIYLDHFAVIGYFIHTADQPRRFVRRISDPAVIDQYHVDGDSSGGREIFYDKTRWNLDLADSSVYQSFAACLTQSGLKELTLFFFTAGGGPFGKTPEALKQTIIAAAAGQGLLTTKVVIDGTAVYAAFARP